MCVNARMQRQASDDEDRSPPQLHPAPEAWIARALEVPKLEQAADMLDGGEIDDAAMRAALTAVGLEPDDRRMRSLGQLRQLRLRG